MYNRRPSLCLFKFLPSPSLLTSIVKIGIFKVFLRNLFGVDEEVSKSFRTFSKLAKEVGFDETDLDADHAVLNSRIKKNIIIKDI